MLSPTMATQGAYNETPPHDLHYPLYKFVPSFFFLFRCIVPQNRVDQKMGRARVCARAYHVGNHCREGQQMAAFALWADFVRRKFALLIVLTAFSAIIAYAQKQPMVDVGVVLPSGCDYR